MGCFLIRGEVNFVEIGGDLDCTWFQKASHMRSKSHFPLRAPFLRLKSSHLQLVCSARPCGFVGRVSYLGVTSFNQSLIYVRVVSAMLNASWSH